MTPTNLQLATHYKLNKDTVQKWKKTRPEVYQALKDNYLQNVGIINMAKDKGFYCKCVVEPIKNI